MTPNWVVLPDGAAGARPLDPSGVSTKSEKSPGHVIVTERLIELQTCPTEPNA